MFFFNSKIADDFGFDWMIQCIDDGLRDDEVIVGDVRYNPDNPRVDGMLWIMLEQLESGLRDTETKSVVVVICDKDDVKESLFNKSELVRRFPHIQFVSY